MSLISLAWDGYSQPGLELWGGYARHHPLRFCAAGWLARLKEESLTCVDITSCTSFSSHSHSTAHTRDPRHDTIAS